MFCYISEMMCGELGKLLLDSECTFLDAVTLYILNYITNTQMLVGPINLKKIILVLSQKAIKGLPKHGPDQAWLLKQCS